MRDVADRRDRRASRGRHLDPSVGTERVTLGGRALARRPDRPATPSGTPPEPTIPTRPWVRTSRRNRASRESTRRPRRGRPAREGMTRRVQAYRQPKDSTTCNEHDSRGVGFIVTRGGRSHHLVLEGPTALINLNHRGARGYEQNTGDGAGILIQIPHAFLAERCRPLGIELPGPEHYGVWAFFT